MVNLRVLESGKIKEKLFASINISKDDWDSIQLFNNFNILIGPGGAISTNKLLIQTT